jgi:hypothetical protein
MSGRELFTTFISPRGFGISPSALEGSANKGRIKKEEMIRGVQIPSFLSMERSFA